MDSRARLRFTGSDSILTVECSDRGTMDETFRHLHRQRFGYSDAEAPIVVEAVGRVFG